jgi:hypothetical protein
MPLQEIFTFETKLRGLSPRANYTDRASDRPPACRRSPGWGGGVSKVTVKYGREFAGLGHFISKSTKVKPRLSTAGHAPSFVAHATTAVCTLERSYGWPLPSLSPLYFSGQTFARNTLYSTSLTISLPTLRLAQGRNYKTLETNDMQRPQEAWSSPKSMNVLLWITEGRTDKFDFFTSLGTSLIHQHVCSGYDPWFGNQTTVSLSWHHGTRFDEEMPLNSLLRPRFDLIKLPTRFCSYGLNKALMLTNYLLFKVLNDV